MPVKIPTNLPSKFELEKENIFVMTDERALSQDIRPLKIAVLNLMPDKIATETQLLRLIGNTPLQVEVVFMTTESYTSKHTSSSYLKSFYKTFAEVTDEDEKFDGLIITGAPVEKMDFTEVAYWDELSKIFKWASKNVYSSLFICWAAQAAMFYYYGINKHALDKKLFGIYKHEVFEKTNPLVRGFDDYFYAPHSRYTDTDAELIKKSGKLDILAASKDAGVYLAASKDLRRVFVFGHGEYDAETLKNEYVRDIKAGLNTSVPENYFINGEDTPPLKWRAHESLLFANWLNYCVYQSTPFNIQSINE